MFNVDLCCITTRWIPNILLSLFMCWVLNGCHGGRCSSLFLDPSPMFDPSVSFALVGHSFQVSGSVNVAPRYCFNQIAGSKFGLCDYSTCIIRGLLNSKRKKGVIYDKEVYFTFIINCNIFMMHFLINIISPSLSIKRDGAE